MNLYNSPEQYLYNLKATSSSEAKRIWRKEIKEKWNNKCAYCDSEEKLTIDHIIPQSKGGCDFTYNVVSCCENCNKSKSHEYWETWFKRQNFFTPEKRSAIMEWMDFPQEKQLYKYRTRRNNAS